MNGRDEAAPRLPSPEREGSFDTSFTFFLADPTMGRRFALVVIEPEDLVFPLPA
jgi:hypothetical protein